MNKNWQSQCWRTALLTVLMAGLAIAGAASTCEQSRCAVSLRLEQENLNTGVRFWLTGSVYPFQAGSVGQTVRLTILGPQSPGRLPAGQAVFDGDVALDMEGSYRYQFHFQRDLTVLPFDLRGSPFTGFPPGEVSAGLYQVYVCYGDAICEALVPVLPPSLLRRSSCEGWTGSAIIVAGYGGQIWNHLTGRCEDLQNSVNTLAKYAYTVLRWSRCLPGDRIYLLHPDPAEDCDLDGQPDVDAAPTVENLKAAIENWALQSCCIGQQEAPAGSPLTIYIVSGSAIANAFYINKDELVSAGQLASWLSTLQAGIQPSDLGQGLISPATCGRGLPVAMILEFPLSGSFIHDLATACPGLTIVTSSEADLLGRCQAHIIEAGGLLSFSHPFWNRILLRGSVELAWSEARRFILDLYDDQNPQFWAAGNAVTNEPSDESSVSWQCPQCSQTDSFQIYGEAYCAMDQGTVRLESSCVVGQMLQIRVQVRHSRFTQDCGVYVVVFPPAGVTRPNIIVELPYSHEEGWYVGSLLDGLAVPGRWQLLYMAVDPDGRVATMSRNITALAPALVFDEKTQGLIPAPAEDGLSPSRAGSRDFSDEYPALLDALAAATKNNLSRVADTVNNARQSGGLPATSGLIDSLLGKVSSGNLSGLDPTRGN